MRTLCLAAAALAAFLVSAGAQDGVDTLNAIISGGPVAPQPTVPRLPAPQTDTDRRLESFPITAAPLSALRVITARPLAGQNCRDALFAGQPMIRTRLESSAGEALTLPLDGLCMLEFRNDAGDRALRIRLDQRAEVLAMSAAPQLFSGLDLFPNQAVAVPLRDLPIRQLDLVVEAVWAGERDPAATEKFTLVLAR
ncbi:MAG: hypothetical protein AAF318_03930 [Pseudomonadota bacterium]